MTISRKDFLKMVGAGALGASLPAGKGLASPKMETARAEAKRLKIQDVEIYNFDIPLTEPFTITLGTITTSNGVLIRITETMSMNIPMTIRITIAIVIMAHGGRWAF